MGLPIGLSLYTLLLARSLWIINIALLATLLAIAGGVLRRYALIVTGAGLLGFNYITALVSSQQAPSIWSALFVGIGLLALLEVGYDWTTAFRSSITLDTYWQRGGYLIKVLMLTAALTFLVVTLALNFLVRLPGQVPLWLTIPGVIVVIGSAGYLIRFWLRRR
jgi:hypothetical protein